MRRRSSMMFVYGGGGIRTPVWFPTHRFRGGPVRPTPAPLQTSPGESPATFHRGARIRTGDLCDPNAALYRTEPRPVPPVLHPSHLNGRGGIRTHVGFRPHDFQSCALSRSATRPGSRNFRLTRNLRMLRALLQTRREWDSNPRGLSPNALAGRRLKPLGHPSRSGCGTRRRPVAPLGLEPRLSGARIRRVANYTTGQSRTWTTSCAVRPEPPVGLEPTTPSLRVTCSTS